MCCDLNACPVLYLRVEAWLPPPPQVTVTGGEKAEPTQTPPFMVCSTVTRKCFVRTHPEEGGSQVSVNVRVTYLLESIHQGNSDFTQMPSTLRADSDSPKHCQPRLRSLVMAS